MLAISMFPPFQLSVRVPIVVRIVLVLVVGLGVTSMTHIHLVDKRHGP